MQNTTHSHSAQGDDFCNSTDRQALADQGYIEACHAHRIEPAPPKYSFPQRYSVHDGMPLDPLHEPTQSLAVFFDEAKEETGRQSELETLCRGILDLIIFHEGRDPKASLQAIALRAIMLGWLCRRGYYANQSLSEIARKLGVTKALLSFYARQIETLTELHSPLQKLQSTPAKNRQARLKYLESDAGKNRPAPKRKGKSNVATIPISSENHHQT